MYVCLPIGRPESLTRAPADDWEACGGLFRELRFVSGDAASSEAMQVAGASDADRVLLLPYSSWNDVRVSGRTRRRRSRRRRRWGDGGVPMG